VAQVAEVQVSESQEINWDNVAEWLQVPRATATKADWDVAIERRAAARRAKAKRRKVREYQERRNALIQGDVWC
jgi:hypothetical protein